MPNDDSQQVFEASLGQLQNGSVVDFLRHDGFPAWVELASDSLCQQEFVALARANENVLRRQFRESQVCALARRLILSRDVSLFSTLRPLWRAFGSSEANCD